MDMCFFAPIMRSVKNILYCNFCLTKNKLKCLGALEDLKAFVLTEIDEDTAENINWQSPSSGTWNNLKQLHHYGVCGIVNDWFRSYLSNRIQTMQVGDKVSDKELTTIGVPQGSVLGPLLFLIYVNDIYNSSNKLQFYLFADDTNLMYADKDLKILESILTPVF